MKQPALVLSILLAAPLYPGTPAFAAEDVEVTVNGIGIPRSRVDIAVANNVTPGQADTPELRKRVLEALINQEIIAQAAITQGLDKDPLVAGSLDQLRQQTLFTAFLLAYFSENPITDEMLRAEYDRLKPVQPTREYRIRHITVATQERAAQLIAQLRTGASFEKLAAEHSVDASSAKQGGDLGWITPDLLVPSIAEAVAKLGKGQLTDAPVRSEAGWHVVRVDDERPTTVATFEQARQRLQEIVQNRIAQQLTSELRAKAKIE